jgi:hypothetical protein
VVLGTHTPRSRMQGLQPLPLVRRTAFVRNIRGRCSCVSILFVLQTLFSPDTALTKCILFNFFFRVVYTSLLIVSTSLCIAHMQPLFPTNLRRWMNEFAVRWSGSNKCMLVLPPPSLSLTDFFTASVYISVTSVLEIVVERPLALSHLNRPILWPMPVFVLHHVLDLISSGSLPVLVSRGPTGCRAPPVVQFIVCACHRTQIRRAPIFSRMTLRRPHILPPTCFSFIYLYPAHALLS